jgi:hypothetical protein
MKIWPDIEGLSEFSVSSLYSREWYKLNRSTRKKYYIDINGNITIKREKEVDQYILEHGNGKFVGTNHGEWGGELFYKYKSNEYIVIDDNICGILNFRNDIYVLTGLSHLSISEGKIIKLKILNGEWVVDITKKLNGCPETFTIYRDKLYIVTFDGITTFDGNNTEEILSGQIWGGLYPQTIYVNKEMVAIGLRGCIVIINRKNNKIRYYKQMMYG